MLLFHILSVFKWFKDIKVSSLRKYLNLCSTLIMALKNMSMSSFPECVNITLFGKMVFTDIIKYFEIRRLCWVIQVGPKCHRNHSYKERQREEIWHTQRRRWYKDGSRDWSDVARECQKILEPPETRRSKEQILLQNLQRKPGPAKRLCFSAVKLMWKFWSPEL